MDTRDNRVQNLLFLLSAAPIGLGCVIVSDDTDTDANATTTSTSTTSNDTETPATGTTAVATDGMTSDTTAAPGDTTVTPGDTTVGPGDSTGNTLPGCEAYATLIAECYMSDDAGAAALNACAEYVTYYGDIGGDCLAAFEDYLSCLSTLTCDEIMGVDPTCEAENDNVGTVCFP